MRNLSTVLALLLAPAAILARPSLSDRKSLHVSKTHKLLTVAVDIDTSKHSKPSSQSLLLTLDIRESKHACSEAKVRVDGYLLSQDDTGAGQGTFATLDGPTVTASWNFTCMERVRVPWDQDLTMTIISLDGKSVPDTTIFASFRQRIPAQIYEVGGDSVFYTSEGSVPVIVDHDALLDEIESLNELPEFDDNVKAEVREMEVLKQKIYELEATLESKELRVMEQLGFKSPSSMLDCKDFSCVFQSFSHKAQYAHSDLCETMDEWWKAVFGCSAEEESNGPLNADMVEDRVEGEHHGRKGSERHRFHKHGHGHRGHGRHRHHRKPYSRIPLLLIVAESAITFGFCFYYLLRCVRRRIQLHKERRERGRGVCRFFRGAESWLERRARKRARREARKEAIRAFFRNTAQRLFYREECDGKEKEGILSSSDSTMEDEIASFQEAASVVGDLISVEEGRFSQDASRQPKPVGFMDEDDTPPAYDSDAEGTYAPMVANGRQYRTNRSTPDNWVDGKSL